MGSLSRGAVAALLAAACAASMSPTAKSDEREHRLDGIEHVLLISVDGLHAVDLANCQAAGTCPHLSQLTEHGLTYTNASTTKPSDSFPGMLAPVTGATSKSTGVFYDDSYDRTLFAPAGTGKACSSGPGTEALYAEPADHDLHSIDGGVPASLTGKTSAIALDPNNMPAQRLAGGVCAPVWPHNFVRTNSIFGVVHQHHMRTAWSDKHPAYDILNGNDPDSQPSNGPGTNIDDFFAPEINSDLSAANVNLIHSLGLKSTAPDPKVDPCTPSCTLDFTSSIDGVEFYDGIKVQAVLSEINGFDHTGKLPLGTPAIFGMNFQSVSVGQKLTAWGYADSRGTPTAGLASAIAFVDRSIGQMTDALRARHLANNTLIIVSAKHGQSPIDKNKLHKIDQASLEAAIGPALAFDVADDVALIWLKDPAQTKAVVDNLSANHLQDLSIGEILSGEALKLRFQDPAHDARTPDIIVTPDVGVIYSLSKKKIAEHGGFAEDDVHVALVVSNPQLDEATINTGVQTTQIAPTILRALGLDPQELDGVRLEGTPMLPGLK